MKKLSLLPYPGALYVCAEEKEYHRLHRKLFGGEDMPLAESGIKGRCSSGAGPNGIWTCLIWYTTTPTLVHELSHCVLDLFSKCGIDPVAADGEPFCYLLEHLMSGATSL